MDFMDKPIVKIIIQFVYFELLFLFLLNTSLTFFNHREIDLIYYGHINLYYLITCFAFLNLRISKLNRFLILLFLISSFLLTSLTLYSFFAWSNSDLNTEYDFYYFYIYLNIAINSLLLFISTYLLFYIKKPYKKLKYHILKAGSLTFLFSLSIYSSFFISFDVIDYFQYFLNKTNNIIFWINFVILLLFWYEFVKQKHNLSEYIANIVVIYTIIIGVELVHIFLIENDILIHNFGQYFTAILNMLMLITWIVRLHYLQSPQAKENEYYITNYKILYGLVEKPRVGIFEQTYHKLNRRIIWALLLLIGIIGSTLFLFNQFNLFISKNIFLLIFALIVSTFFAILYWDKRWFQGIEFLIRKKNK
jgi:hypothetical protein